jgi:hypothetical protein
MCVLNIRISDNPQPCLNILLMTGGSENCPILYLYAFLSSPIVLEYRCGCADLTVSRVHQRAVLTALTSPDRKKSARVIFIYI